MVRLDLQIQRPILNKANAQHSDNCCRLEGRKGASERGKEIIIADCSDCSAWDAHASLVICVAALTIPSRPPPRPPSGAELKARTQQSARGLLRCLNSLISPFHILLLLANIPRSWVGRRDWEHAGKQRRRATQN